MSGSVSTGETSDDDSIRCGHHPIISLRPTRTRPKHAFHPSHTFTTLIPFHQHPGSGDVGVAFKFPESLLSFEAPIRNLSYSAVQAFHAPDWFLYGLRSFKTSGKVPTAPGPPRFFASNARPTTPVSMNRVEEFIVRTGSPRHF
jgi:hypothetical protein